MASLYRDAYNQITQAKADKLAGKINSLMVPFRRLSKRFPGWERGTYTIFTANSGVGKTKISKYLLITSILHFIKNNPQLNVRIRWYALEETKNEFALSFISTILALKESLRLSAAQMKSLGEFTMEEDHLEKIDKIMPFVEEFMAPVTIIDDIYNPYGIWKDVRNAAAEYGQFYFSGQIKKPNSDKWESVKDKKVQPGEMFTHYIPNDPKEFVFVITDHVSLLSPEKKHKNQYECIGEYSQDYCLAFMRKKLNYHVVNIQQQTAEKEKQEYTFQGKSIDEKLEPSLDGLANNKETQRDADLILGFFSPTRYGINNYHGYDISKLKDRYRSILFLKDRRYGMANARVHCFFDGATNVMNELPKADEMTPEDYKIFGP